MLHKEVVYLIRHLLAECWSAGGCGYYQFTREANKGRKKLIGCGQFGVAFRHFLLNYSIQIKHKTKKLCNAFYIVYLKVFNSISESSSHKLYSKTKDNYWKFNKKNSESS